MLYVIQFEYGLDSHDFIFIVNFYDTTQKYIFRKNQPYILMYLSA